MNYRQPFQPAADYDDQTEPSPVWNGREWVYGSTPAPEPLEPDPIPLTPFQRKVITGLKGLAVEVGGVRSELASLAPRVHKLEADARWKQTAAKFLKLLAPALAGALVAKFPQLASALAPLLEAIGSP